MQSHPGGGTKKGVAKYRYYFCTERRAEVFTFLTLKFFFKQDLFDNKVKKTILLVKY